MDYESNINFNFSLGWYSVTPEELAVYTAEFCKNKVIIDGFCGSGGNVIQVK
jgi:trimethylguanosine synthase